MSERRQRRSAEEWALLVAEYRAGSEDDATFCERRGLSRHTFRRYKYGGRRRRSIVASQHAAFAEVRITSPAAAGHITVHGVDGVRIELPIAVGIDAVLQLAKGLQRGR